METRADSNLGCSQQPAGEGKGKALSRFVWGVRIHLNSSSKKIFQGTAIAETSAAVKDIVVLPSLMIKP